MGREGDRKWVLNFVNVHRMNVTKQRVYDYTLVLVVVGVAIMSSEHFPPEPTRTHVKRSNRTITPPVHGPIAFAIAPPPPPPPQQPRLRISTSIKVG